MKIMLEFNVSVADAIIRKRYVLAGGRRVYGTDISASVALQTRDSWLHLWINTAKFQSGKIPYYEFFKELAELLGIPSRNHNLVMAILENNDRVRIEQKLEEAGYGASLRSSDLNDQWIRDQQQISSACSKSDKEHKHPSQAQRLSRTLCQQCSAITPEQDAFKWPRLFRRIA